MRHGCTASCLCSLMSTCTRPADLCTQGSCHEFCAECCVSAANLCKRQSMANANVNLRCSATSSVCREFSGQSATSPQRSAHSLGGLPVGGLAVGRGGQARGERGLSSTKASGLSSSKKRGDAMRRSEHHLGHSRSCDFCCLANACTVQQESLGLLQEASSADALCDDPADVTQHALHERCCMEAGKHKACICQPA